MQVLRKAGLTRISLVAWVALVAVPGLAETTDSLSMASPSREPIWTARLFIIALNDADAAAADAVFGETGELHAFGEPVPESQRRPWIEQLLATEAFGVHVKEDEVEGDQVVIIAEWWPEGQAARVRMEFHRDQEGLIEQLTISESDEQ